MVLQGWLNGEISWDLNGFDVFFLVWDWVIRKKVEEYILRLDLSSVSVLGFPVWHNDGCSQTAGCGMFVQRLSFWSWTVDVKPK